jgi:trans-2,3-dihydro-3-hydroxyanthranilate isomerase
LIRETTRNSYQGIRYEKKLSFYIFDVFTEKKFAGDQLAVFRRAEGLSSNEMQQIAREINFSETTFVISDE